MRHLLAGLAMAWLATPAAAQDEETVYMGIDLTAEPEPVEAPGEPAPDQRELGAEMRPVLDEGVELGCLSFEPPATFSQTDNDSAECRDYISRVTAATAAPEQAADVIAPDNPEHAVPLVTLAQAAQSGNKRAKLELGRRFEEGRGGVEVDLERALILYREAAAETGNERIIQWIPGDANANPPIPGRWDRSRRTPRIPGLPEAQERANALEARMASEAD